MLGSGIGRAGQGMAERDWMEIKRQLLLAYRWLKAAVAGE